MVFENNNNVIFIMVFNSSVLHGGLANKFSIKKNFLPRAILLPGRIYILDKFVMQITVNFINI